MMCIGCLYAYISTYCVEIEISSGLCTNQWKPLEMKEVANCSTYNYTGIKKLMIEVRHASYTCVYYVTYMHHKCMSF